MEKQDVSERICETGSRNGVDVKLEVKKPGFLWLLVHSSIAMSITIQQQYSGCTLAAV